MAGPGIDQAGGFLAKKNVIQTGLVAPDAGIDFIVLVLRCFLHEIRVRQKWPSHGYHVGITARQHLFGHFRRIDAVAGYQGHRDLSL